MLRRLYLTTFADYFWLGLTLTSFDNWVNGALTPLKASAMVLVFLGEFARELLHMHVFFYHQITDEARCYRPDKDLIMSILRLKVSFGLAAAFSTYYGYFVWDSLSLSTLAKLYLEYLLMILVKDLQLDVFHRWMHHGSIFGRKIDRWISSTHKLHHRTKLNLNSISAFYTSMEDAVMENLAAPFAVLAFKWWFGWTPTIHIGAFMMYIVYDVHGHSANPYSVVFFNPILDYYMKANIAHHNHHVNGKMNHRVIPWRHFWNRKEVEQDLVIYNSMRTKKITLHDLYGP